MAVQLPKIQRNDVYDTSQALPEPQAFGAEAGYNLAEGQIKMVGAVDKALDKRYEREQKLAVEQEKQMESARKIRAKSLANQYNMEVDTATAEFAALPLGNDLSKQYASVKTRQEAAKEKLRSEAYDDETKRMLDEEFVGQDAVLNKAIEVKYAQANVAYKTRTAKDSNDISKRNFIQESALYDPNDPTSFAGLDKSLLDIDTNTLAYVQSMGLVSTDSSGQPIYPDAITKDVKNQQSDAVKLSISSLVGQNDTGRALAIFNRYGNFLNEDDKVVIQNQLTKASNEKQHHTWANQIINQNPEAQQKALDTIGTKFGLERKERVGNIVSSLKADKDKIVKETNQRRLQEGISLIEDNQKSPTNRWYTVEEMRNDPKMAGIYDKADYATKKKLDQLVKKPEFSDKKAFDTAMQFYNKPDGFKGMANTTLQSLTAPLDQGTTNLIKKKWREDNGLEKSTVPPTYKTNIKNMVKLQLDQAGLLSPAKSGWSMLRGKEDKSTASDKNKVFFDKYEEQILNDLNQVSGEYPPNSPQALQLSKQLAAKYIKNEEASKKSFFSNWFGSDKPVQPPTPPQQKVAPAPTLPTITSATTTTSATVPTASGGTVSLEDMTPEQRAAYRRQRLKGTN